MDGGVYLLVYASDFLAFVGHEIFPRRAFAMRADGAQPWHADCSPDPIRRFGRTRHRMRRARCHAPHRPNGESRIVGGRLPTRIKFRRSRAITRGAQEAT